MSSDWIYWAFAAAAALLLLRAVVSSVRLQKFLNKHRRQEEREDKGEIENYDPRS